MRRSWLTVAAGTALLAAAPLLTAPALAAPHATAPHAASAHSPTVRTVVRPVTSTGHAVPGYRVHKITGPDNTVNCSQRDASPAAVDDDIFYCSPDAAGALACWRAARAHHVLCLEKAEHKVLYRFRATGRIAHTTAPEHRGPLDLELANGVVCGLRDGGAASTLRQHPSWSTTYYCTRGKAVWAPHQFGIDRSRRAWTVELAGNNGRQDVHIVGVKRAYLVGTQH